MKKLLLIAFLLMIIAQKGSSQKRLRPGDSIQTNINVTESNSYIIKAQKGDQVEFEVVQNGIDVTITISFADQRHELDYPRGLKQRKVVAFESEINGDHLIELKAINDSVNYTKSGAYTIRYVKMTTAAEHQKQLQKLKAEEEAFSAWLRTHAIPIKSVKAETGLEDLQPLKQLLANKRVVAMGESTHGTSEFLQMRHRLFEFLVKEMGFTVFAVEASYARTKYINDYVLYGKGSLDTALSLGAALGSVEENRQLIEWMRNYNQSNPVQKIQFVGYDVRYPDAAALTVSRFYEKAEPHKKTTIDSLLKVFVKAESAGGYMRGDTTLRALRKPIEDLLVRFVQRRAQYLLQVSEDEYEQALWDHKILHQFILAYAYGIQGAENNEDRDFYMAQNVLSWLAHFPKGTKMLIYAHNGHIGNGNWYRYQRSMGSYLKQQLKDDYYAIGVDFFSGQFQANDADVKGSRELVAFEVGEPMPGSLGQFFVKAGLENAFVDFRSSTKSEIINTWLYDRGVYMHLLEGTVSRKNVDTYFTNSKLGKLYDGVLFIKSSTRALPVKRVTVNSFNF